ncbi:hypothetical protein SELMODRAFT_405463 [Selaginella moellendorffii]|uniref:Uncharacterized protein n=1 Tax=Selaginella moellendorffii TaxID=88036 RepID=D8QYN4_SELML|nr:uncharacterized protein LOC9654247 [Selaginella moellendorffii]EFJ34270.1 hypothetical protein SELMODRAFT_405463 [Selaginella moellendorffii]|eukprot:XP_002963937.1 uncharacterized protein LOC9654247 [Selaginella moellendorffii]
MDCVWVTKDGEGEALRVPLHDSKHLMVDSIAAHWGLDAATLRIGQIALFKDANGNSVMTMEQIAPDPNGDGDGQSQQSPFVITGKRNRPSEEEAEAALAKTKLGIGIARAREQRKRADHLIALSKLCQKALFKEFYDGSRMYSYSIKDLVGNPSVLREEVANFVGTVHITSKAEASSVKNCKGMVTLIRPDGSCITALRCIDEILCGGRKAEGKAIVVSFPRIKGGVSYECKVGTRLSSSVVCLEPQAHCLQALEGCLNMEAGNLPFERLYTFGSHELMNLVNVFSIDPEAFLPASAVQDTGAPVFDDGGILAGVVTNTFLGRLGRGDTDRKRKLQSFHGRHLQCQKTADLDKVFHRAKLHSNASECMREVFLCKQAAIHLNRVVQFAPVTWKTPIDEWNEAHPLESFEKDLPQDPPASQEPPRRKNRSAPRKLI